MVVVTESAASHPKHFDSADAGFTSYEVEDGLAIGDDFTENWCVQESFGVDTFREFPYEVSVELLALASRGDDDVFSGYDLHIWTWEWVAGMGGRFDVLKCPYTRLCVIIRANGAVRFLIHFTADEEKAPILVKEGARMSLSTQLVAGVSWLLRRL